MIYFIGIKGTGMAALACILHDLHKEVAGSDQEKHFFTEEPLRKRGIRIDVFNEKNIHDNMTVIIGNAFDEDFPEVKAARQNPTVTCYRYHEYLGKLMEEYTSISIAGSHGKTTTTGMMASMLAHSEATGYLIGDGSGLVHPDSKNLVVESCEYRRHFLAYKPDYAVITNIEIDHVDYFKDEEDYRHAYEQFSYNVNKALIVFGDDEEVRKAKFNPDCRVIYYGEKEKNDVVAKNIVETSENMSFDVEAFGKTVSFTLPFVGRHLLWNSLAVITLGLLKGIEPKAIEEGLANFHGVKRRFVIEKDGDNIFVDDYAHHPTEVSITIDAAKKRFPDHKIVAIFKPHRASRVYYFKDEFANALKKADQVYLCDFTSIDDHADGVDIDITYLQQELPNSKILSEDENGAKELAKEAPAVYLFMSSKDIYHLAEKTKAILNS